MERIRYSVARGHFWQIFVVLFQTEIVFMPTLKDIYKKLIIKIHIHQFTKRYNNASNIEDKLKGY